MLKRKAKGTVQYEMHASAEVGGWADKIVVKIERSEEDEARRDEEGKAEAVSTYPLASGAQAQTSERQTAAAPAKRPAQETRGGKGNGNAPATPAVRRYAKVLPCNRLQKLTCLFFSYIVLQISEGPSRQNEHGDKCKRKASTGCIATFGACGRPSRGGADSSPRLPASSSQSNGPKDYFLYNRV